MENNIGAGVIVAAAIGTSLYIYNSDKFDQVQKTVLLICIIFPPLQWIGILIALAYNSYRHKNSKEVIERNKITKEFSNSDLQIRNLRDLKEKGLLTEEEYNRKKEKIQNSMFESELKLSDDYKKLLRLRDDGILTDDEFKDKLNLLKKNYNQTDTLTEENFYGKWNIENGQLHLRISDFSLTLKNGKISSGKWWYSIGERNLYLKFQNRVVTFHIRQHDGTSFRYINGKTNFTAYKAVFF